MTHRKPPALSFGSFSLTDSQARVYNRFKKHGPAVDARREDKKFLKDNPKCERTPRGSKKSKL